MPKSSSNNPIWTHFTVQPEDEGKAECNICKMSLSFKSTTGNLKRHIRRNHKSITLESTDSEERDDGLQYVSLFQSSFGPNHTDTNPMIRPKSLKRNYIWMHFTVQEGEKELAQCNICKISISFKSTTANLKRHIRRHHPFILLDYPFFKMEPAELENEPSSFSEDLTWENSAGVSRDDEASEEYVLPLDVQTASASRSSDECVDSEDTPTVRTVLYTSIPEAPAQCNTKRKQASETVVAGIKKVKDQKDREDKNEDEFTHFGNNVASQLRNLPLEKALYCQTEIMRLLTEQRIQSMRSTSTTLPVILTCSSYSSTSNAIPKIEY